MVVHINPENASLSIRLETPKTALKEVAAADGGPLIQRVLRLAERQEWSQAVDLLHSAGQSPSKRNALGVCLMRSGQIAESVRIFRNLVLNPGSTWERPELPDLYKRNFATALLLSGLPAGCLDVLRNAGQLQHPAAIQIRSAIKDWEKSLSWWRRWDWKLNLVEPPHCSVKIGFTPGEFEHALIEENPARALSRSDRPRGKS